MDVTEDVDGAAEATEPVKPCAVDSTLSITIEQAGTAFSSEEKHTVDALVTLRAPEHEVKRPSLDLVCVVDVSGSMGGSKLVDAMKTLQFLIRQLRSSDRLAIVLFDSNVSTLLDLTPMNSGNRAKATASVSRMSAGSCTNLSGGLIRGLEILNARKEAKTVTSVFLLTDGQANEGITTSEGITAACKSLVPEGASIYTFGYGADHDCDMLKALSEVTVGGMYYFIENEETIPIAFAEALSGLQSVVAQNLKLELTPMNDVTTVAVETSFKTTTSANGAVTVNFGDLQSGEERDIIVHYDVKALACPRDASMDMIAVHARFFNVMTSEMDTTVAVLSAHRPQGPVAQPPAVSLRFRQQKHRLLAARVLAEAKVACDARNFKGGRELLQSAMKTMKVDEADPVVQELIADLAECLGNMHVTKYAQSGKHQLSSYGGCHARQRCALAMTSDLTPQARQRSSYSTPMKNMFKRRAAALVTPKGKGKSMSLGGARRRGTPLRSPMKVNRPQRVNASPSHLRLFSPKRSMRGDPVHQTPQQVMDQETDIAIID